MWCETEEEEEEEDESEDLKGSIAFCLQVEHAGTRTYYFSADSHREQEEWIQAMSDAARVNVETRCTHIKIEDEVHFCGSERVFITLE